MYNVSWCWVTLQGVCIVVILRCGWWFPNVLFLCITNRLERGYSLLQIPGELAEGYLKV